MQNNNDINKKTLWIIVIIVLIVTLFPKFKNAVSKINSNVINKNDFYLISSESNRVFGDELIDYAKKNKINLRIDYYEDLEIVDKINENNDVYDGVWISNSIWLYMLNNSSIITDSKSIAMNPVVMGISKSKAKELDFIDKEIYNVDILNVIKEKKLNYVMTSVTQTNTGATAYLSFLNSLAGSPEVLTSDMLKDENLIINMREFFKGVSRVSGNQDYLDEMFMNGEYDAIINYEQSLIELNKKLVKNNKEPLYLIYPVDGVGINDMPFAYINHGQDESVRNKFLVLQDYLRSDEVKTKLENLGYRSWYGGVKENTPSDLFNKDWGIDTTKYLIPYKYPSKSVMNEAFDLYIDELRKPTHVVFCLDVSGSMYGSGLQELQDAMSYVLDNEKARIDKLQFSKSDKITILTFESDVVQVSSTYPGNRSNELISFIDGLYASGGTNIYDSSIKALSILKDDNSSDYTKTVILMTDGQSNNGTFISLRNYYNSINQDIPIYSITFGDAKYGELQNIATLTNAKVFDGKNGLKQAFLEVRSYN